MNYAETQMFDCGSLQPSRFPNQVNEPAIKPLLVDDVIAVEKYIKENTGLVVDSYFSATKIKWIIDNVDGVKHK